MWDCEPQMAPDTVPSLCVVVCVVIVPDEHAVQCMETSGVSILMYLCVNADLLDFHLCQKVW